ncbi:hypothetical protein [Halobellus limi]|jgi:hypothetical protein|uniref:Uncharacterized protein n=1 Tax=Halobellus limi TaxID=699433 RepID=A0A1H5YF59_9EURY|nr:hypothetical protein [Halobellus limi]QCC48475.1 hypothetical protein DV707_12815 [Halobellus limi]SEG22688.1 hypothetical protein SAMN04488133_1567 [Halobellus limi]
MTIGRSGWIVVGSLVLCVGLALVGVNAFAGRLWHVVAGFVLFVVGYRTMQYGVHGWPDIGVSGVSTAGTVGLLRQGGGLAVSVVLAAYGFVLMGRAVRTAAATPMVLSGVSVVLGYVIGHRIANDEVL